MENREVLNCALSNLIYCKPSICRRINENFENYEELFTLKPHQIDELANEKGIGLKLFSTSYLEWAKKEVEWYASKGVEILDKDSPSYPPLLRECSDAPIVLYFRGKANLLNPRTISIIGTRIPSDNGLVSCSEVVRSLAQGGYNPLIISGLAMGIDVAAHRSAMKNSLQTVAVLPCGINQIYPSQNRGVAASMIENGGVLTEFPRGVKPLKHNFLQRNRIIAGMAVALVVVQTRICGGSMSTTQYANSYSREVFALPGRLGDINSYGCNYLISRNVASIYLNSATIPKVLGWGKRESDISLSPNLFSIPDDVKEKILLTLTSLKKCDAEDIVQSTGLDAETVCSALLELEFSFKVKRDSITNEYMPNRE